MAKLAYASSGGRLGEFRYYFADVAAQQVSAGLTEARLSNVGAVDHLMVQVATGVAGLVDAFLGSGQQGVLDKLTLHTRARVRRRKRSFRVELAGRRTFSWD